MTQLVFVSINLAIRGAALAILWSWFAAPLGLPELTWVHVIGLLVVVGLAKGVSQKDIQLAEELTDEDRIKINAYRLLLTVSGTFIGWLAHLGM